MRTILLATAAATLLSSLALAVPASAQQGSYQASCRNTSNNGGMLTAECGDGRGGFRTTTINASQCRGDISNNGGTLVCNGATATGGQNVAQTNNNGRGNDNYGRGNDNNGRNYGNNDRRDDNGRRNNNDVAVAAGAGLVAGAMIGNANAEHRLYAPGYAYPTYGQSGYGDPRSDPRYAQGGYAYGRQGGQWMPIAQRGQWLEQRIDQGARQGTLSRREVRGLRQELTDLETTEARYRRGGLQNWEMADLDKRFDLLASRIRYERATDNGYRNR
jgi:hypothetical protein